MKSSNKNKVSKLLLSHKEMAKKYQELRKDYEYPYFYKIAKNGRLLYFVGARHTNDPKNYQIKKIRKQWESFLEDTKGKSRIVLIEGGRRPVETSETSAIIKHNGPGHATYLAHEQNIETLSPEPDEKQEIDRLLKRFSKEEIIYYYFARLAAQWNRLTDKPPFKNYLGKFLKQYEHLAGWSDFEFSVDNLINIHNRLYKHKFDKKSQNCVYKEINPSENKVSSASGKIRDTHIVAEIKRLWDEGKNIFIVYGSGHAIVQEPALKRLLK